MMLIKINKFDGIFFTNYSMSMFDLMISFFANEYSKLFGDCDSESRCGGIRHKYYLMQFPLRFICALRNTYIFRYNIILY